MKVTQKQTESEWKKVEQTETEEFIRCDVCAHDYPEDEWDGHNFEIDPGIERESGSLHELDEIFDSYHTSIPKHVVRDGYDGTEMGFDVPKKPFLQVLSEEAEVAMARDNRTEEEQLSISALKQEFAEKIGSHDIYLVDGEIHHFRYVLNIEATTEDHKHVCDDCYDVIFD